MSDWHSINAEQRKIEALLDDPTTPRFLKWALRHLLRYAKWCKEAIAQDHDDRRHYDGN